MEEEVLCLPNIGLQLVSRSRSCGSVSDEFIAAEHIRSIIIHEGFERFGWICTPLQQFQRIIAMYFWFFQTSTRALCCMTYMLLLLWQLPSAVLCCCLAGHVEY